MKRMAFVLTLVLAVLSSAIASALSANSTYQAENSLAPTSEVLVSTSSPTPEPTSMPEPKVFSTYWDAPPGAITQSPTIIILSPQENKTYTTDNIVLRINVGSEFWVIDSVYYEADWSEGTNRIFTVQDQPNIAWAHRASITVNFTGVPDGSHNIAVYANIHNGSHGSSTVSFATDVSTPRISVLSIGNKTYYTTDLPLNFTVDEPTTWVGYGLNGGENTSISGNTTLSGLSVGAHNITVYAIDIVGHDGASETIYFTVVEPFPTTLIAATTVIVAIAVIGTALLVYFTKIKKTTGEGENETPEGVM